MIYDPDTGEECELPEDYTYFILATKVYQCLPKDLLPQDKATVLQDLEYWNAEQAAIKEINEKKS